MFSFWQVICRYLRLDSCGRSHALSLDTSNKIWNFTNWGHPFWLSSPVFQDPNFKPVQIECGWMFSCVLTHSGDVLVWWPFSGQVDALIEAEMIRQDNLDASPLYDGTIPCVPWALDLHPTRLPSIPALPDLDTHASGKQKPTQLIQVAGLDKHLIGLTNKGHVLMFDSLDNETEFATGRWQYVSKSLFIFIFH
jgi:SCF-associated factor 1